MNKTKISEMYSKALLYNNHSVDDLIDEMYNLNSIEKIVFKSKLGIGNNPPMNNEEIAKYYLLYPSYVSQKLSSAYKKIKVFNFYDELEKLLIECPGHSMDELLDTIKYLSNREKQVIILKLGLNGRKKMSIEEIVKEMNLSYENVNVIYSRARKKIKKLINEKTQMEILLNTFDLCDEFDVIESINSLSKIEQVILKLHMGLLGINPMKNKDIAILLDKNHGYVDVVLKRANDKLFNKMKAKQDSKKQKSKIKTISRLK